MRDHVPVAEPVFRIGVECSPPVPIGRMPAGGTGIMVPITGGTVSGARLTGTVLPGGADWAVRREDGWSFVDARYAIKAEDGTIIQVFNTGASRVSGAGGGPIPTVLTTPRFVAPAGPHEWLNYGVFTGTLTIDMTPRPTPMQIGVGIFLMR